MTLDELKAYYRTSYNFHKETGLHSQSWDHWRKFGYVPLSAQKKIEKITEGALVARIKDSLKTEVRDALIQEVKEDLEKKQQKDDSGDVE